MMQKNKIIFIAWNEYHFRNESISKIMDITSYHIGKKEKNMFLSALSFIPKSFKTITILKKEKPNILIITNNAWVLPALSIIYCKIKGIKLIFDTHSRGISSIWIAYPDFLRKYFVKKSLINIVTNVEHADIVNKWGGQSFVFPGPPMDITTKKSENYVVSNKMNICYINTYSDDEPYEEVINSVTGLDQVTLYITGNYKNTNIKLIKSKNIVHTGFLKRAQYIDLLKKSDIIMVLTTRDNTFQCGGIEALSLGKPLIISNTEYLKRYFGENAVYVNPNNSNSIRHGIVHIIKNKNKYEQRISKLREEKTEESHNQLHDLLNMISKIG